MAADFDDSEEDEPGEVAQLIERLGYLGLFPFIMLAAWLASIPADHDWRAATILLLSVFAAAILSFLGGIRWGLAMRASPDAARRDILVGLLPMIVAWVAPMIAAPISFVLLAIAFAAQGAWDALAVHAGKAPHWYGRLRTRLTLVVVATMILAFVATS